MESTTIDLGGSVYTVVKLSAMQQFHVTRRLGPLLAAAKGSGTLQGLTDGLAKLPDAEAEYILFGLLAGIRKKEAGGLGFAPLVVDGRLMYQNISLPDMLQLAYKSFMVNLQGFSAALPQVFPSANLTPNAP